MRFHWANPFTTHSTLQGTIFGVDVQDVEPGTVIKLRPGDETGIVVERGKPVVRYSSVYRVKDDFDEVRRQTKDWRDMA